MHTDTWHPRRDVPAYQNAADASLWEAINTELRSVDRFAEVHGVASAPSGSVVAAIVARAKVAAHAAHARELARWIDDPTLQRIARRTINRTVKAHRHLMGGERHVR